MLAQLVTDWYVPRWFRRLCPPANGHSPVFRRLSSALASRCDEIPDELVRANRLRGLIGKWAQDIGPSNRSPYEKALQADRGFIEMVSRLKLPPHNIFFGYSYMSLEILAAERARGVFTMLDQIDPGPAEFRLVEAEMAERPELAGAPPPFPKDYYDRLRREWDAADVIAVNSEWSREALIDEGASPAKIEILPLAYELDDETLKPEGISACQRASASASPLRVIWLGQVNVRKGIHYLIEAARLMQKEKIHFDVVGPIGILPGALASAPKNMTFHGPVSRDLAAGWYKRADVFVLPTISDGFALAQLEALAHGLPVVTTHHCARVVEDGKNGYVVPARDAQALADVLLHFVRRPGLASEMRCKCLEAAKEYSIDSYGQRLVEIIQKHLTRRKAPLV